MTRILGLTPLRFILRVVVTVTLAVVNLVIWYFIPTFIYSQLQQSLSSAVPLPEFSETILIFSSVIIIFSVLSSIFRGHPLSFFFAASGWLASAYYLVFLLNGGILTASLKDLSSIVPTNALVGLNSLSLTIDFQPIFYLILVPTLLGVIMNVWQAINQSATAQVIIDEIIET